MKTRNIYSGLVMTAAVLLCLAGCKKDEEGEKIMLGTQFEKAVSAQKTYLGENNTVCWSAGDEVKVNNKTCEVSSEGIAVTENTNGYAAVYPATEGNTLTYDGDVCGKNCPGGTVEIPATQNYTVVDNKQVLNGPMAARLDGKSGMLYFRNLYSLLKVTVSADNKAFTVNSITVTATDDNAKALAGTYGFSFVQSQTGKTDSVSINTFAETGKDSSKSVKLTGINSMVAANNDADFYLVAHPMAAQKLTVRVSGLLEGKAVTYIYSTGNARSLNRNSIGGLGVNLQQLEPKLSGAGIGRFKIGENTYVTFAPGNLQYQASSGGAWRFAEHQWDIIGNNPGNTTTGNNRKNNSAWIDLFSWGMSGAGGTRPYWMQAYDKGCADGLNGNIANTDYDWGVYNDIYNPQFQITDTKGTWRTLTSDEWNYLKDNNNHVNNIRVNDIYGMVFMPESVTIATSSSFTPEEWMAYERKGCVFLPHPGLMIAKSDGSENVGSYSGGVGLASYYWSSTSGASISYAIAYKVTNNTMTGGKDINRYKSLAVRLAHNIE